MQGGGCRFEPDHLHFIHSFVRSFLAVDLLMFCCEKGLWGSVAGSLAGRDEARKKEGEDRLPRNLRKVVSGPLS